MAHDDETHRHNRPERTHLSVVKPEVLKNILEVIKHPGPARPRLEVAAERHDVDRQELAIRHRLDLLNRARESIPAGFQWAHYGPELDKRVTPRGAIAEAQAASTESMLIVGPPGSGKTSLACAILRDVIHASARAAKVEAPTAEDRIAYRLGVGARFMSAWRIAKAQIYHPLGQMPPVLSEALTCSVLVLDDLGMDYEIYRASASAVREVLHERHAEHRRTIVTTYLRRPDIEKHYGAGIARRLGEWRPITLGAKS